MPRKGPGRGGGHPWAGGQALAGPGQALLTAEGHPEVTALSPVGGGSDTAPPSRVGVNHSLACWHINGTQRSPSTSPLLSSLLPLLPAVSRRQAGDPWRLVSLSTQRLALQGEGHLTPGEEDPFLSAWEKCGDEDEAAKMGDKEKGQFFGGKS